MPDPHSAGVLGDDSVRFRRFAEDDLHGLQRLYRETPETARDPRDSDLDTLREQFTWPGHAPARDRWVVVEQGQSERLVGYSSVFKSPHTPRADMLVVTHPALRRRGLGAELLRRALADAQALGATDAAIYINDQDVDAAAFLTRRGFTPVGAYNELCAAGDRAFPEAQWLDGYAVRAWRDVSDLPTLADAANRCYAGLWGHNHATAEEWAQWLPAMDPHGIFFLSAPTGEVVGMARADIRTTDKRTVGVVDAPGVVAELRDAGLYRPLLLHALNWLAVRRPAEYVIESWGDASDVLADYLALGFEPRRRETLYRYPLAGAASE